MEHIAETSAGRLDVVTFEAVFEESRSRVVHTAFLIVGSLAVAEEIEGKTAITLLSKPINRRQFIVGKFLGIELGAERVQVG